jgi:tetratricopeptide (TPR) repeat protein
MRLFDLIKRTELINLETSLREAESLFLRHEDDASARLLAKIEMQTLTPEQRWWMLLLKGWLCHAHLDHAQAMKYADMVLSESQDAYYAGRAHHLRGLSHCGQAYAAPDESEPEVLAAITEFKRALDLLSDHPERFSVYSSLAILLADTNQVDEAIAMLETIFQQSPPPSPDLDWLHATLGELYAKDKGDCSKGVEQLELAASLLDPESNTHSWVHSLLAECYNKMGEYEQARVHAKRALELAKQDKGIQKFALVRAHEQYANALDWGDGDRRLAERHLRTAIEIVGGHGPRLADLYIRLGEMYYWQKRFAEAQWALEQALHPENNILATHASHVLMGDIAFAAKDYSRAVHSFELALAEPAEDKDNLIRTHLRFGAALYHLERYGEAAEVFRAGLREAPANHPDWSALMKWLLATNSKIEPAE